MSEEAVTIKNDSEKKDTKKKKKKVKVKGKLLFLILGIICVISLVGGYFLYTSLEKDALKTLKKNYGEYVITSDKVNLYDKNQIYIILYLL